jgi:hypothetical protein
VLKRKRTDVPPSVFREMPCLVLVHVGKPRLIARQVLPTTMATATPWQLALTIRAQSERVCFVWRAPPCRR